MCRNLKKLLIIKIKHDEDFKSLQRWKMQSTFITKIRFINKLNKRRKQYTCIKPFIGLWSD